MKTDSRTAPKTSVEKKTQSKYWPVPLGSHFYFEFNLTMFFIYLIVLTLLLKLGFWQLDKRAYKISYNQQVQAFLSTQHQPLSYEQALLAYERVGHRASDVAVRVAGRFRTDLIIYHDNRIQNGQAGLQVLAIFDPILPPEASEPPRPTLVNLGWAPWPTLSRDQLPEFKLPSELTTIEANLFVPNPNTLSLETVPPPPSSGKWLVQKVMLDQVQAQVGETITPFTLRLQPGSAPLADRVVDSVWQSQKAVFLVRDFGATTQWPITPEKHLGYAVQWFTMAVVLTLIYIKLNLKRSKNKPSGQKKAFAKENI